MFIKWLEQAIANWDELLKALRSRNVQLMYFANQIEQMLDDPEDNYNGKNH